MPATQNTADFVRYSLNHQIEKIEVKNHYADYLQQEVTFKDTGIHQTSYQNISQHELKLLTKANKK